MIAKLEFYGTRGSIVAMGTLAQDETGTVDILVSDDNSEYDANQNRTQLAAHRIDDVTLGNMYTKEIDAFCDYVINETDAPVSIDEAIYNQKIVEASYASSESGKFIDV